MNGKAVIFDVDGLMLDTERLAKPAWTKALADFGYAISDEFYLQLVGRSVKDVSRMLKEELGEDLQLDEILEHRYQIGFDQIDRGEVRVKFGLYDVLDFLDMNSIPKAVASSSSRLWTDKKFAATGLDRRFDVIVCGDEVAEAKPAPDVFLEAARRMGVPARECIVLEDSEPGVMAAYAAGMAAVMVPDIKLPSVKVAAQAYFVAPSLIGALPVIANLLHLPSPFST